VLHRDLRLALCWLLCLTGGMLLADPPSQMYRGEGPRGWPRYSPDDERSRITAVADVVTPHIEWARPWAGGSLRVLAIAHKEHGRWPIELSQRFDFRVTTVYTHSRDKLGVLPDDADHGSPGRINQRPHDVEARLLQAMNEPVDVVINDVPLSTLGSSVTERMAQLVQHGVGYVGSVQGFPLGRRARAEGAERDMLRAAAPITGLKAVNPAFKSLSGEDMVRLWDVDSGGRVADLTGFTWDEPALDPGRLQYSWLVDLPWEVWCSLAGRAALWAARRVSAAPQLRVEWPRAPISWAELPYSLPTSASTGAGIILRVWDADGRLRHQGSDGIIPQLPVGRYFVGLQRHTDRGITDWTFGSCEVTAPYGIASVTVDGLYKRPEDRITAIVRLAGRPAKGCRVQFEVVDNYDRCIFRRSAPAQTEVAFSARLAESLHIYNYAQAKLFDAGGRLVDEARHSFYVRQPGPPRDDLSVLVFGPDGRYPSRRIVMQRFVEMGMNAGLNAQGLAPANVHPVKYDFRLVVAADDRGYVNPNIASLSYIEYVQTKMRATAKELAPFSPLLYYLGDDVRYLSYGEDGGWNPEMRSSLAEWARETYGDLDHINQAWESSYSSFDEIAPIKLADALAAVRSGHQPRYGPLCHWVDHQLHTDRAFARFHRQLGDAIREADPGVPSNIGSFVVGWTPPGSGFDFWQLAEGRQLGFQYPNPWVHEIFRSALAPDALQGTWYGGYGLYNYPPSYLDQDFLPWWGVFHGLNVHGLYYGGIAARWFDERLLGPDLSFMPGVAKIVANHDELRSGIAKLLFNAHRVNDGVAIVYSPASIHVSAVFDRGLPKAPEWEGQDTASDLFIYMQCWEGLMHLVRDLGFSFDVVPSSLLDDGHLLERDIRVLVLPLGLRIGAPEAEAIRHFVARGGVLVADALPGVFDERCRADHAGVIADVLGVKLGGGIPGAKIKREAAAAEGGTVLPDVVADGDIVLAGAHAQGRTAGGTPIFLVHRYGQGSAILLNVLARDYQIWRTAASEMPFRETVGRLLTEAGIEPYPDVKCVVGSGGRLEHPLQVTEVHRYELGAARYVGLLRHHKLRPDDVIYMADLRPKPVSITFDEPRHVYDMRSGMYRGHTDTIEDMIYPARAELYALLPYEVRDLAVRARWVSGAVAVEAEIVPGDSEAQRVPHVFHIEVTDPEGRQRVELTRNTVAPSGRCQERLFVGYNAKPDGWRVTIRDAASGMTRRACVASPVPTKGGRRNSDTVSDGAGT
jgi:hypothetical protein